jgi:hypothetical protein
MAVRGAESMSDQQLAAEIRGGARIVTFQYCISVVVVTLKRSSDPYLVRRGESAFLKSLPWTAVSLVFGWWGIPWGFIYTPWSLIVNLSGGKDVTSVFAAQLGQPAAPAQLAYAQHPGAPLLASPQYQPAPQPAHPQHQYGQQQAAYPQHQQAQPAYPQHPHAQQPAYHQHQQAQPAYPQHHQAQASVPAAFSPGSRVRVHGADGQVYPGVLVGVQQGYARIAFEAGREDWVPLQSLSG